MEAATRPFDLNQVPPADASRLEGREFRNLDGVPTGGSLTGMLRWKLFGPAASSWPERPQDHTTEPTLPGEVRPGEMAATLVGHSTFLLQFTGGLNVLTDPIWSERASPVSFAGPKRARPPAISWNELPEISLVLVTHGHYDHLDLPTLRRLEKRFHPLFVTGLRQGDLLRRQGFGRVEELDWWQSLPAFSELEITFTPAQHWSNRTASTLNRTLWGGFYLRQAGLRVYFAGDSGLGRNFALVREYLGAPHVAFLPIGAYEPRWFMRIQHMNPDDAVQAHLALGAQRSVGMHFGTFQLTDESIDAPAKELATALQARGVNPASFRVPNFGETMAFAAE